MNERITKQMIENGLNQNIITSRVEGDGLKAYIGDYWFYFGGSEFEYVNPDDIDFETLVNEIFCVLDDFRESWDIYGDEYLYYYYYLTENIR